MAAHAGILDTDDQAAIEAKLDAVLREPDPALRQWMRDRIGPLVGLQVTTAPPKEEEAFTAWRRFLEGIAHDGPLVLLIEDLHWADPALVSFLLHVVTTTAGLPITLLVTARPEVEERHAAWLSRARRSTVLSLTALPREAIAELVAAALPDADPELLDIVLERSAGSPLYADQLAAMLRSRAGPASALDEEAVPPTIQALLAARIDALPRDVKPVLLDASVVGRTFWSGAVARIGSRESEVIEPALTDLAQRELTRPSFPSTMEGEAEFAFWHALLRDVAYGELPRKARMQKHRFAAEWISERSAGSGRTAEIVAEHYARALDLAIALEERDELDDLRAGLAAALLAAADQSMSTGPSQAVSHLRRAIDLLPERDPRRADAVSRLGEALYALSRYPEARDALGEAIERYRSEGNPLAAAAIAPILALATANTGDPKLAEQLLEEARLSVADQPGPVLMSVMAEQAAMAMRADDHPVAIRLGQDILRMADELGLQPPPRALMAVGGDANYRRAIEIADATGDLRNSSIGRFNRAIHLRTDADTWMAVLDDAIAFDVNHGLPAGAAEHLKAAIAFFDLGRPEGTRELLANVADRAREIGDLFTVVLAEATLQEIRVVSGEPIGDLSEVIRLTREIGLNDVGPLDLMVMAALATGDVQAAGTALEALVADLEIHAPGDEPWSIVDQCLRAGDHALAVRAAAATRWVDGTGPIVDRPARELELATDDANVGRLAEADGDLATARERYEHGLATYSRYDWRLPAARIGLWLGRCLIRMGEIDEGIARLRVAREESERIGLKPWVAEIDAVLAETGAQDAAPALR